jgi:hypothetical protein
LLQLPEAAARNGDPTRARSGLGWQKGRRRLGRLRSSASPPSPDKMGACCSLTRTLARSFFFAVVYNFIEKWYRNAVLYKQLLGSPATEAATTPTTLSPAKGPLSASLWNGIATCVAILQDNPTQPDFSFAMVTYFSLPAPFSTYALFPVPPIGQGHYFDKWNLKRCYGSA